MSDAAEIINFHAAVSIDNFFDVSKRGKVDFLTGDSTETKKIELNELNKQRIGFPGMARREHVRTHNVDIPTS